MKQGFNIFDAIPASVESSVPYAKFEKIGDSVQGTFIKREDGVVSQKYGNLQTVVTLKQYDGSLIRVSIRDSKLVLLRSLDACRLGEIIGFKFVENRKNEGRQDTKVIVLVHDANGKLVDEEWLAEQADNEKRLAEQLKGLNSQGELDVNKISFTEQPFVTDGEKINKIAEIIKSKFGITAEDAIKVKVLEVTGVSFLPANLDLIIERLK